MIKQTDLGFIQGFDWGLYPKVESLFKREVNNFLKNHSLAKTLANRMQDEASTRFLDWVDYMVIPDSRVKDNLLKKLEFDEVDSKDLPDGTRLFKHIKTEFFPLLISKNKTTELALKSEHLEHFLQMIAQSIEPEGEMFAPLRRAEIKKEGGYILSAVERRGSNSCIVKESKDIDEYMKFLNAFFCRKRLFGTDGEGMNETEKLVGKALVKLKGERVADAFFRVERIYWERRNRAGQIQRTRQDRLGLGWANHDHHTYRSSRENFVSLVRIFEKMGYVCREKFYAGAEARWGAQILEHPVCDIVIFADVDLFPEETEIDFPHRGLGHRTDLGTVGLWVGLHGESILQAGMHHLEARFDFNKLRNDLPNFGVTVMKPFSYFAFLKQAFTQGDIWQVDKKRLEKLLKEGSINKKQYSQFFKFGAMGSHLENLQRDQGYKGFNQKSVTAIIKATDPRKYKITAA